ncbi:UvrD-helicase domain-containing protein [Demequina sp. NBRC 110051]|uniref:UvrD-helicase domain-containing protein n=1 Tax=Demequina sp. NBRC 110051 TaxID=1570340 RepID=UPI0009FFD7BD|nr:UvrD-helicase domain-containing protein [Demequina sp. NBRC 110051]
MATTWHGARGWSLTHDDNLLTLTDDASSQEFRGTDAARLTVRWWWFGRALVVSDGPRPRRYRGLRRADAVAMRSTLARVAARGHLGVALTAGAAAKAAFERRLGHGIAHRQWVAYDDIAPILAGLPSLDDALAPFSDLERATLPRLLSPAENEALAFLSADHLATLSRTNKAILDSELAAEADFFARVERSPLTTEQAHAVVSHDSRVRVIAAAGSGKTSVMVARAAYVVHRGFVPPERILMLAFNADAARELRTRVETRMGALGLDSTGIEVSTFHAFGLKVIGAATGRKPRVAPWVEQGKESAKIEELVDRLRDRDLAFRFRWDLFRLLHGKALASPSTAGPDSYDPRTGATGFATYRGETVKSEGERLIADWLYLHGVDYRYEHPYAHDVADAEHGQYRPDFYYPAIDAWHEHWALQADGTVPEEFTGYADSMRWKRDLHARYGTTLIETASHAILDHSGFEELARTLEGLGVALDWNPDRSPPGAEPLAHERLSQLVRTFMAHVKGASLSRADVEQRVRERPALDTLRTRLFLDLYWPLHDEWEADLRAADAVDFDDMLARAATVLERDPALARWDLVMVDEFQDTSRTRARIAKALTHGPGKHLLAVGDDWQAINRFAGADLEVMTGFAEFFGPALTRRLETTFRCTQTTADVAGRFVSRNPAQLPKTVRSFAGPGGPAITVMRVDSDDAIAGAIGERLRAIAREHRGASVDVLGRYRHDRSVLPRDVPAGLRTAFRTIHGSKGLEADHIVVPRVTSGRSSLPSTVEDDPVLALAMAEPDPYPFAEERRLLYVALTRARHTVTLVTVAGRESPFILELLDDPDVEVTDAGGQAARVEPCRTCGEGTLVRRRGKYGDFYGCSTFPRCSATVRAL